MSGTNVENYDALVKQYGKILNDKEERLSVRFRALFSLKNLNGKDAIDQIGLCFDDTSELLKHELAYCLGQMGSKDALDLLKSVLENHNQGIIFLNNHFVIASSFRTCCSTRGSRSYRGDWV